MKTQQKDAPQTGKSSYNLLDIKPVAAFIKSRWYPDIFQIPVAIVFTFIIYELLFGPAEAHDNFGTAGTWVLWWPLLPILLFLFGRLWCTVCPFGTLNDFIQKIVGSNRPVPKFLQKYGIWIIDLMFIAITWSDHIWGIVESPRGSGVLLMMMVTAVVLSGAVFERRTWCRYLCFLGGVCGNYSRAGMLKLRATPTVCKNCKTASCYKGSARAPGCPMFEFPRTMDTSAECNLCGNCVKSCPNGSIRIEPALPTSELWSVRRHRLEVAFLAVVIMGIVFVQNVTMLDVWSEILSWLERETGVTNYPLIFTVTFLIAMLIPILILSVTSAAAQRLNGRTLWENFATFGYAIIPLDMAGHIAHNLFHILAEGKSVFYTLMGVFGREMAHGSTALLDDPTIQALQYILITLGTWGSIYVVYRSAKGTKNTRAVTLVYGVMMLLFAVLNILLFTMPMSMRM